MSDDLKRQIEEALRPLIEERDTLKAERTALLRELDVLAASYVTQLANLQRENEALRAERDAARADAERLTVALKSLLGKLNGYEHHPDLCSRTAECDELEPHEFCSQCGDEVCPACECGLHETQQAMQVAAVALAAHDEVKP